MRRPSILAVLAVLLLLAAPAVAAVDLEVSLKATVQGTIGGAGQTETFRFYATAGTILKVQASGKGLDLALSLLDPGDRRLPISAAPGYRDQGSKIVLSKFPLPTTGYYTILLENLTAGTYKLKLKGKPAKKTGDTFILTAGGKASLLVSAPAGSAVTLQAKAAKKSPAEPRWGDFDGSDRTDEGKFNAKRHTVKLPAVSGGDLPLVLKNIGTETGGIVVRVKIKAPKIEATKLDVRTESLGGGTAVRRSVDSDQGGTVEIDDPQSEIDGAGVAIDAGAMPDDTAISVTSAPAVEIPADRQAAGPAVEFGPAGLTFSKPVTIRLPYDPGSLPPGTPASSLRVLHVKGKNDIETLTPTSVNEQGHELTVEVTSFSTFMPTSPKGPPNPAGKKYWAAFYEVEFRTDQGNDSRERVVLTSTGEITVGNPGVAGTTATIDHVETRWNHDGMDTGTINVDSDRETVPLTWNYNPGNTSIRVGPTGSDPIDFEIGPGAKVMIAGNDPGETDPVSVVRILLEKSKTVPTTAQIAGEYWILSFALEVSGGGGPLTLGTGRTAGTVTLKSNGDLVDNQSGYFCEFDPGFGQVGCERDSWNDKISWSIAGANRGIYEGAVVVSWTDEGVPGEIVMMPGADGNIAVGLRGTEMVVIIRKGSGDGLAARAGDYRVRGLDMDLAVYQGGIGGVGDIEVGSIDGMVEVRTNGTLGIDVGSRNLERDSGVAGGVAITTEADNGSTTVSVGKTGSLTVDNGGGDKSVGAMSPSGGFGCLYDRPQDDNENAGLLFILKKP